VRAGGPAGGGSVCPRGGGEGFGLPLKR
jgi:hypothetical protein